MDNQTGAKGSATRMVGEMIGAQSPFPAKQMSSSSGGPSEVSSSSSPSSSSPSTAAVSLAKSQRRPTNRGVSVDVAGGSAASGWSSSTVSSARAPPMEKPTTATGQRRLMHSISIVVDPVDFTDNNSSSSRILDLTCNDDQPEVHMEQEQQRAATTTMRSDLVGLSSAEDYGYEEDATYDADESAEDHSREDDAECLSSDLAKRVFIVDEADKMLLLRATTASPQPKHPPEVDQVTEGAAAAPESEITSSTSGQAVVSATTTDLIEQDSSSADIESGVDCSQSETAKQIINRLRGSISILEGKFNSDSKSTALSYNSGADDAIICNSSSSQKSENAAAAAAAAGQKTIRERRLNSIAEFSFDRNSSSHLPAAGCLTSINRTTTTTTRRQSSTGDGRQPVPIGVASYASAYPSTTTMVLDNTGDAPKALSSQASNCNVNFELRQRRIGSPSGGKLLLGSGLGSKMMSDSAQDQTTFRSPLAEEESTTAFAALKQQPNNGQQQASPSCISSPSRRRHSKDFNNKFQIELEKEPIQEEEVDVKNNELKKQRNLQQVKKERRISLSGLVASSSSSSNQTGALKHQLNQQPHQHHQFEPELRAYIHTRDHHLRSSLGFCFGLGNVGNHIVSGPENLELEVRGEREFNEQLRKASPIPAAPAAASCDAPGSSSNRATSGQTDTSTSSQHHLQQHHRDRQWFDPSVVLSSSASQGKRGSLQEVATGYRRLTLDSGKPIRAFLQDYNQKYSDNRAQLEQRSDAGSSRANKNKDCDQSTTTPTTTTALINPSASTSSNRRTRRVSFGNIDDNSNLQSVGSAGWARSEHYKLHQEETTRKNRLSSVTFGEPAPQLLSPKILPSSNIDNTQQARELTSETTNTNQQLENLIRLTRENFLNQDNLRTTTSTSATESSAASGAENTPGALIKALQNKRYSISAISQITSQVNRATQAVGNSNKNSINFNQQQQQPSKTTRSQSIVTTTIFKPTRISNNNNINSLREIDTTINQPKENSHLSSASRNQYSKNFPKMDNHHGSVVTSTSTSTTSSNKTTDPSGAEGKEINLNPAGSKLDDHQENQQMASKLSSPSSRTGSKPPDDNNKSTKNSVNNTSSKIGSSSSIESIMANAKLRQEEFARLLEEHEQIVNEINRVETKMSTSQSSLQQQLENINNGDNNTKG